MKHLSNLILGTTIASLVGCSGAASPPPSAPSAQFPGFVNGTVQTATPDKLTLSDGETFNVSQTTAFFKLLKQTASDLKAGQFVRTTATAQPDGSLVASAIVVPVPPAQNFPPFQFPIGGGSLMSTAHIKSVDASGMTITLATGDVLVTFAPEIEVRQEVAGSLADITPSSSVLVVAHPDRTDAIEVYV